jgi:hypothetical protein
LIAKEKELLEKIEPYVEIIEELIDSVLELAGEG